MVSGEAPAQLNDYNADGLVNVQDAIDDPSITVISNEASVQFLQYSENILSAGGVIRAMFADLDDSGDIEEPSCGGGQGSSATRGAPSLVDKPEPCTHQGKPLWLASLFSDLRESEP